MLFIEVQDCVIQVTITSSPSLSLISCKQVALCLFSVAYLATGKWSFGTAVCAVNAILKLSLTKVSAFTMTLMDLNRYYKVVKPNKYQAVFKPRNIVTSVLPAWIIPMTFVILLVSVSDQEARPSRGFAICIVEFATSFYPVLFGLIYSPYFSVAFCYWKIYWKVKIHKANVSWQSSNAADVKVSKTLFVRVVSFVGLLLPAHIIFTFRKFESTSSSVSRFLSVLAAFLIFMTSCTNPFIYGYMNRAFRSEFKKCLMPKRGH